MNRRSPTKTMNGWLALCSVPALVVAAAGQGLAQRPGVTAELAPEIPVYRHSPLFGLGPQTLYRGAWGFEVEGEWVRAEGGAEEEQALHVDIHHGVTEDLTVGVSLPLVQRKSETVLVPGVGRAVRDITGVGDAVVRAKYRFWHNVFRNGSHQASLLVASKLPVGPTQTKPALGSGSVDFLAGVGLSRETHWYYTWASVLGRINTAALNRRRGNEVRYEVALGVRPYVPQWTSPDLMLLLELTGVTAGRSVEDDGEILDSGGTVLGVAPGFWLTYRNWALKGGLKLPVLHDLNGDQPKLDFETLVALEYHIGG